jgi:outer membrane protein
MKRVLIIAILLLPVSLLAQTEKGKWLFFSGTDLTAVFGTNTIKYDGNDITDMKTSSFELKPGVGYFIANNFALGVTAPLTFKKNGYNTFDVKESTYGASILGRYYFGKSNFKPYVTAEAGYLASKSYSEMTGSQYDDLFSGPALAGGIGLAGFINEHVSLDIELGYVYSNLVYSEDKELKMNVNGFGIQVGFSIIP